MKINIKFLLLILLSISVNCYSQNNCLKLKTNNIDIGIVKEGTTVELFFEIENPTKKVVKLFSVSSTCGCTIPQYPNYIYPNQQSKIRAQFNSTGFSGRIKKELVLVTNDSIRYYKLSFFAQVIK